MAQIDNPRKDFNFSIQVVGAPINPFLVQEVNVGESSITQAKHGDTNHDIKTGGRVETGETELEKILSTSGSDTYMWNWHRSVQDATIGGGLTPQMYKRTLIITELAEDGTSILNTWILTGVWPMKINGQKWNRKSSENSIEKISLSVDRMDKV